MKAKTGRAKKVTEAAVEPVVESQSAEAPVEPQKEPYRHVVRPEPTIAERIAESRKSLEHPIGANQKFFESPDGEIIVGEADRDRVWSRTMNNGKGGWANPRREGTPRR